MIPRILSATVTAITIEHDTLTTNGATTAVRGAPTVRGVALLDDGSKLALEVYLTREELHALDSVLNLIESRFRARDVAVR